MKPTEKQIALYKQIRQITEKHHEYSDQMMELAIWIDSEFEQKGKRTVQHIWSEGEQFCYGDNITICSCSGLCKNK